MTDAEKLRVALRALKDIMRADGVGLDLSPPGPCHDIAKEAWDKINHVPTKEEILAGLNKPRTYPNTRMYPPPPSPYDLSQGNKGARGLKLDVRPPASPVSPYDLSRGRKGARGLKRK